MRYLTSKANTCLFTNNGKAAYRFGPDGVLIVGSLTTATGTGNYIDAALKSDETLQLMRIPGRLDLQDASVQSVEMCGQGSLDALDNAGSAISLEKGYTGFFFPAPVITPGATTVPATAGIYYRVLTGSVTYDSVTYTPGQEFVSDGSTTTTSGTGTFALTIPPAVAKKVDPFLDEAFKEKHLLTGDEYLTYYNYAAQGYTGYESVLSTDADYYGHTV